MVIDESLCLCFPYSLNNNISNTLKNNSVGFLNHFGYQSIGNLIVVGFEPTTFLVMKLRFKSNVIFKHPFIEDVIMVFDLRG